MNNIHMTLNLTIAIPTFNEEIHLASCIEAIGKGFAKEVFIIDSNSTDKTKQIADELDVKVINFTWDGKYPKKRNWFIQNHYLKTEWILFLDADEKITKKFKKETERILLNTKHSGFYLSYSNHFLNKKLKGGVKFKKLALFRINSGEYERIDENNWSNLDMEVHEHPILKGSVGQIKAEINHMDFKGMSRYIEKHNQYSSWEAERYLNLKNKKNFYKDLTFRQKVKYSLLGTPFYSIGFFLLQYFFLGGWKDGKVGLTFALLKAGYYIQVYSKIYEKIQK
tara:strand:- start:4943 stop:5785 length:843 start_codon:yes stop_codon:yes gene_type:complete